MAARFSPARGLRPPSAPPPACRGAASRRLRRRRGQRGEALDERVLRSAHRGCRRAGGRPDSERRARRRKRASGGPGLGVGVPVVATRADRRRSPASHVPRGHISTTFRAVLRAKPSFNLAAGHLPVNQSSRAASSSGRPSPIPLPTYYPPVSRRRGRQALLREERARDEGCARGRHEPGQPRRRARRGGATRRGYRA